MASSWSVQAKVSQSFPEGPKVCIVYVYIYIYIYIYICCILGFNVKCDDWTRTALVLSVMIFYEKEDYHNNLYWFGDKVISGSGRL